MAPMDDDKPRKKRRKMSRSEKEKRARARWERGAVNRLRRRDQLHTLAPDAQARLIKQEREMLAAFFSELARTGSKSAACRKSGMIRATVDLWYKARPEFRAAYDAAMEEAADLLEEEARRRATEGVERLKFDRAGNALTDPRNGDYYVERDYSDTLILRLLEAARPEKYRQRQEIRHTAVQSAEVYATRAERLAKLREAEAAIMDQDGIIDAQVITDETCVTGDTAEQVDDGDPAST